jgi:hypothetical protein
MENDKGELEDIFAWRMFGYPKTIFDYIVGGFTEVDEFNPRAGFQYHHDFQSKADYDQKLM